MTDYHSHILPGMDDGSKNPEMTEQMLLAQKAQGVERVIATPHFYATQESIDSFIARREKAIAALPVFEGCPEIIPGAEVYFFDGVSRTDLDRLCIKGTSCILVEMPFSHWTTSTISEIFAIEDKGYTPIIAHIERYLGYHNKKYLSELLDGTILIQSNAEFFIDKKTRKDAIKMLKKGEIHLLGSDCHNLDSRHPNIGEVSGIIPEEMSLFLSLFD